MFELFEHTADLGLRVEAADEETLFADAARGLFAMIVEELHPGPDERPQEFRIDAERRDLLLLDWLSELLYTFETGRLLLRDFRVVLGPLGLVATAQAQPLDFARHRLLREVKAITYHGLRVERTDAGWLAEVIVDI